MSHQNLLGKTNIRRTKRRLLQWLKLDYDGLNCINGSVDRDKGQILAILTAEESIRRAPGCIVEP